MTPDPTPPLGPLLPEGAPTPGWRRLDRVFAIGFVVLLLVPAIALAAGFRPGEIENRPLAPIPQFGLGSILDADWYRSLDAALTDRLALRPLAIQLRAKVASDMGGTGSPQVLRGEGDWLFYTGDFTALCNVSADMVAPALDALQRDFTAAGQRLRVIVAPDKSSIYPDKLGAIRLPPGCAVDNRSAVRGIFDSRSAFAIDAWQLLMAARAADPDGIPMYYRQDTHWTPTGAAIAIRGLIDSLEPGLWDEQAVRLVDAEKAMDLAGIMGLPTTESSPQVLPRPGAVLTQSPLPAAPATAIPGAVFEIATEDTRPVIPGRTLIVYDSFFRVSTDIVAPFFAHTTWISAEQLQAQPDLGQILGPFDLVIFQRVERSFYQVPIDQFLRPLIRGQGE